MVNTFVDETRHGNVYLPGDVLILDWPSKERAEGPQVTILGIPVGINYPKVIYEQDPGQQVQVDSLAMSRNGEGSVVVRAHIARHH